ncbi:MAG: heparan-alpha-glucosaminide N-acetyltransferase domain-containing protein [Acidobacteriota bacterium]
MNAYPMSAAPAAAGARPPTSRIVFLDLARAAAVLFMVQGHTIHQLLDQVYEPTLVFQSWLFLRGLTSCMFLLLSGFAFSVASDKYWDDHRGRWRRVARRLIRFSFFLGLGYLIHFPMGRFAHLEFASDERWRSFLQVDVLQVVAVSLLLLQGLILLLGTRRRFAVASALVAGVIALATPLMWSRTWVDGVPLWLASYLSSDTGSIFPFFPWGTYLFAGAALGMAYARRAAGHSPARPAASLAWLGGMLAMAGLVGFLLPFQPLGTVDPWRAGPAMLLIRLGLIFLVLGGFVAASRWVPRLPRSIQALSQESLMIYVVHVAALYGSLWAPGLGQVLGRQDLFHTVAWIGVLFVSMTFLAWVWNQTKRQRPLAIHVARAAIAVALIWPLI